jgi:hypothetical protein
MDTDMDMDMKTGKRETEVKYKSSPDKG